MPATHFWNDSATSHPLPRFFSLSLSRLRTQEENPNKFVAITFLVSGCLEWKRIEKKPRTTEKETKLDWCYGTNAMWVKQKPKLWSEHTECRFFPVSTTSVSSSFICLALLMMPPDARWDRGLQNVHAMTTTTSTPMMMTQQNREKNCTNVDISYNQIDFLYGRLLVRRIFSPKTIRTTRRIFVLHSRKSSFRCDS